MSEFKEFEGSTSKAPLVHADVLPPEGFADTYGIKDEESESELDYLIRYLLEHPELQEKYFSRATGDKADLIEMMDENHQAVGALLSEVAEDENRPPLKRKNDTVIEVESSAV